jgi:hypothetical protein
MIALNGWQKPLRDFLNRPRPMAMESWETLLLDSSLFFYPLPLKKRIKATRFACGCLLNSNPFIRRRIMKKISAQSIRLFVCCALIALKFKIQASSLLQLNELFYIHASS